MNNQKRRQTKLKGRIPTDEEMEAEDLAMQAEADREANKKIKIPPTRGKKREASSLMKKISGEI